MLPKKYNTPKKIFYLALLLLISYFISNTPIQKALQVPSPTPSLVVPTTVKLSQLENVLVLRVVDGDTILIEGNRKLRYIGMNAPESVDPRRPVQCFGKEASKRNQELVEGKTITIEKDVSETDKYGRLLRYVYLDGVMINKQLVEEGYAVASSYPPDIKHQPELRLAQKNAITNHRGLWADCPSGISPTPKS